MEEERMMERFNYFEKLLFKVTLLFLGISVSLVVMFIASFNYLSDIPRLFVNFTVTMLIASGVNFFVSLVRIFKFAFKYSSNDKNIGITRSAVSLLLNPVSFIILYILLIIMALSSCTVQ